MIRGEHHIAMLNVKDGAWVFTHYQTRLLRECEKEGLVGIGEPVHHSIGIYASLTDKGRAHLNLPPRDASRDVNVELLIGRCDTCGLVDHHLDQDTGLCPKCKNIFGEVVNAGYTVGEVHPNASSVIPGAEHNEATRNPDQTSGFEFLNES